VTVVVVPGDPSVSAAETAPLMRVEDDGPGDATDAVNPEHSGSAQVAVTVTAVVSCVTETE
jgi:hypothetical protein